MYCRNCGNEVNDNDKFCRKCGTPVDKNEQTEQQNQHEIEDVDSKDLNEVKIDSEKKSESHGPTFEEFYGAAQIDSSKGKNSTKEKSSGADNKDDEKKGKNKIIIIIAAAVAVLILALVIVLVVVPKTNNNDTGKNVVKIEETKKQDTETNKTVQTTKQQEANTTTIQTTTQPETTTVAAPYNQQIITIQPNGGTYMLTLDQWNTQGKWDTVFSCEAKVSENGTTTAYGEGIGCTPSGTFDVLFCIGTSQPRTSLNYVPIYNGDVWVDDSYSSYYNTLQSNGVYYQDWSSAENIYNYFSSGENNAGIFFSYNGDGINAGSASPGWGSVMFIFGRYGYSSQTTSSGDILISSSDMELLLSYLDSSKNPQVTIY